MNWFTLQIQIILNALTQRKSTEKVQNIEKKKWERVLSLSSLLLPQTKEQQYNMLVKISLLINTSLKTKDRVKDLLSQLNLKKKV